jgi:hypothetical protein
MHIEGIHIDQFTKILSTFLIWNQQDNPSGHFISLCREYNYCIRIPLLEFTSSRKLKTYLTELPPYIYIYFFFFWLALQPLWPWPHFSFLIYSQSVGLLERVISSSQGLCLNTVQHKHRINTYTHTKHPCSKWDSNPRSQRPSERRQFMP